MAPKQVDVQALAETVSTLAETVHTLAGTVTSLSERMRAMETMLAKVFSVMSRGKWFLFGVAATIFAGIYGIQEGLTKLKGLLGLMKP